MAEPLKDQMGENVVELLAARAAEAQPGFDRAGFTRSAMEGLDDLELKDRINRIADSLRGALGEDYITAVEALVTIAESGVDGFAAWPLCSVVERHGVDHPESSLDAMPTLTRAFSCEFAIRPFLEHHLDRTLERCRTWAESDDEHVRRLVSEGTRPLLPWGPRVAALTADPHIGIALLDELRHDPSEYVRRSVANHLNDIAKADQDLVVAVLDRWTFADDDINPAMVRHALRTCVKDGHPGALALLGFTTDAEIEVAGFECSPSSLALGESIELSAELTSTSTDAQRLVVDFVIHHVNASGATSPKVFKWTTVELAPGATASISKRRKIATASTRRYHAGFHRVELQVAGHVVAESGFDLTDSSP